MNRNTIIGIGALVVVIVIALIVGLRGSGLSPLANPDRTAFLACQDRKAIQVGYSQNQLDVTLSDNRQFSFVPEIDDAGVTHYKSGDISFEQKDGAFAFFENGTSTFNGCVVLAEGNAVLVVRLNERVAGAGVAITPTLVTEDSRCPADVECIQAGTVKLTTMLETPLGSGEQVFTLGQGVSTEAEVIGLTAVYPVRLSTEEIKPEDYQFFFSVIKRATTTPAAN